MYVYTYVRTLRIISMYLEFYVHALFEMDRVEVNIYIIKHIRTRPLCKVSCKYALLHMHVYVLDIYIHTYRSLLVRSLQNTELFQNDHSLYNHTLVEKRLRYS